jgi:RpiR family carbohydrate utilization transcriptional regulator
MLSRIQAHLDSLSPSEQRVAHVLLEDPRWFCNTPIAQLALRAQVSKPTVVRFCRSMGYQGLSDFKLRLASSVADGVPFIHRSVAAQDTADEVIAKVTDNTVAALLKYRNDASPAIVQKVAHVLHLAHRRQRRLEFYGVGNSGIVAQDAQHKFFRMGFHTAAHSDGHLQIMSASLLQEGDVLVIVSNSGQTRDLIDACEIARQRGAVTVGITATGSALAKAVDLHLAADHPESYERFSPMVSRLLHLMILDVLATCTALHIGATKLEPHLRLIKSHLIDKRYIQAP